MLRPVRCRSTGSAGGASGGVIVMVQGPDWETHFVVFGYVWMERWWAMDGCAVEGCWRLSLEMVGTGAWGWRGRW